jgi:hypothetical protein
VNLTLVPPVRLIVRAPLSYVEAARAAGGYEGQKALLADVAARLGGAGISASLSPPIQDPTDPTRFAIVVRPARLIAPGIIDNALTIETVEPVREPLPPVSPNDPVVRAWRDRLDEGLSTDEVWAVGRALAVEDNPRHLAGFGWSFEPWFAGASSVLAAQARRVQGEPPLRMPHAMSPPTGEMIAAMRAAVCACAEREALPADVLLGEVRRAACVLTSEPERMAEGAPPEVVQLAQATIVLQRGSLVERGLLGFHRGPLGCPQDVIVDPRLLAIASPIRYEESGSALQLAMAAAKPGSSRVWNANRVGSRFEALDGPPKDEEDRLDQMRARIGIERALKALERGRWVRWYRKQAL